MDNFKQLQNFINNSNELCFLDENGETSKATFQNTPKNLEFYIPLCPDYSFELNDNNERIHDFSSMGNNKGIVYEKLISQTQPLFDYHKECDVPYKAFFLMADVEGVDQLILNKIGISKVKFQENCNLSAIKINEDLKARNIKGQCLGMEEYFKNKKYDFHKEEHDNYLKVKEGKVNQAFMDKVIELRKDLYNFWFNISESDCIDRSYKDVGMYAAFAEQEDISNGIILCADSEILSCAYNSLKDSNKNKTPVIYVKGKY